MTALLLLVAFVLIVAGALLFTNAVEWIGARLNLGQSSVGSLLAAVGTALPESLIPVVALVGGSPGSTEVAIGSIIGAPFLLGTLAMIIIGVSALAFRGRREAGRFISAEPRGMQRDLGFFLVFCTVGVLLGLGVSTGFRIAAAIGLLLAYVGYAIRTVKKGGESEGEELQALIFHRSAGQEPALWRIVVQLVVGLAAIVGGAELFVEEVVSVAESLGVGTLVLSLVLAPLATELPEKANSILWVRDDKDSLAVGNVTGAMAFQASVPIAFGLAFTEWDLEPAALVAGGVGILGGAVALVALRRQSFGIPSILAWTALFAAYLAFVALYEPSSEPAAAPPPGAPPPGAPLVP
ncbi:MAG: sodium:calcium antiporter, partial [Thermoleophilaceae bacterium]